MKLNVTFSILLALFLHSGLALAESGKDAETANNKELLTYPLKTCPVSGKKLNSMGNAYLYRHEGRLVLFCCRMCVHKFEKDAAKFIKEMNAAIIAAEKPTYPLKSCVVSDEDLGKDAIDYIYGNHLVRFCCDGCTKDFKKDPKKFLSKIENAQKASSRSDRKNEKTQEKHEGAEGHGDGHGHKTEKSAVGHPGQKDKHDHHGAHE